MKLYRQMHAIHAHMVYNSISYTLWLCLVCTQKTVFNAQHRTAAMNLPHFQHSENALENKLAIIRKLSFERATIILAAVSFFFRSWGK